MVNALAAAIGIGVVLGVVAFAVTTPDRGAARSDTSAWRALLPAPVESAATVGGLSAPHIVAHPASTETATSAVFRFTEPARTAPFRCRLDRERWGACRSPVVVSGLSVGAHDFLVRGGARRGRAVSQSLFPWTVVETAPFSIVPRLSGLRDMYPGSPPVVLPLKLINPNDAPIAVTHLEVSIAHDPPGCPSAQNLELIPSNASPTRPLRLRADGSAWVPAHGFIAPTIRLRNLSVSQDACERARFSLTFSGTAHE